MLKNYLQTALRLLTRHKVWSITNLAGLSIGLACVMLILLFVKDEVSFDRFHAKGDHLYRLVSESMDPQGNQDKNGMSGGPMAAAFLQSIPEVQAACRISGSGQQLIKKGNEVIPEYALFADTSFFDVFTFPLLYGDPATALRNENNIVLSGTMARKYFNTTDAVGKTIEINSDGKFETFVVSAVAADPPLNSSIRFGFLLPMARRMHETWTGDWTNSFLNTFFVLRAGADVRAVENKMTGIFTQRTAKVFGPLLKQYPHIYYRYMLQPFLAMHLDKTYIAYNGISHWSNASYSYILGGIAFFILLIACINFINLTLARSLRRGKEIGIRKVSGGTRKQLIGQFMGESLALNCLAFIPALVLVRITIPWFAQLAGKELSITYLFNTPTFLLFGGLIIINTLFSGFYPALVMSNFNPVQTLYGKFRLTGRNWLGKSLVVVQFVIAVFLIIGTVVMQRQFRFMLKEDPGYQAAAIVNLSLPDGEQHIDLFRSSLARYPFIRQSAAQSIDFTNSNTTSMTVNHKDLSNVPFYKMDEYTLPLLQIPVVAGRNFFGSMADTNACIINESLAHASGWKDPVGRTIDWGNQHFTIIGVVRDFHTASMRTKIAPVFICKSANLTYGNLMVRIDNNHKAEAVAAIQDIFRRLYPYHPCDYTFLDDMLASQYKSEQRWAKIVTIAAVLAVFISCMGLFGLATLSIEQRIREIGIRKILGADVLTITRLLSADFVRLVLIAFVIASPLAWYIYHRWLQDFAYRIDLSWGLFLTVGALMTGIAVFTVGFRAARTAMTNPANSLRSE